MKILVLGVTGMLGYTVFNFFQQDKRFETWGTLRSKDGLANFSPLTHSNLIHSVDILSDDGILHAFELVRPDLVINCIGLIKQLAISKDPLVVLPVNSLFPHRVAKLCSQFTARLVHISTDCVFSGKKGGYIETDLSDAEDLYGKSKFIGELQDLPHAITLRTSMIGHELNSNYALVNWFLSQTGSIQGYKKVIFSGFPTIELAQIIRDYIAPNPKLAGLYHVAANPINKYELLNLIAERYQKVIPIMPNEQICIDRSLNAERFNQTTGYVPPDWPQLIDKMYQSYVDLNSR